MLHDRIELSTSPLPRECSTTELVQRVGRTSPNEPATPVQAPHPWLGRACAALAGLGACYFGIFMWMVAHIPLDYPFGDFFALWSYAQIAVSHGASALYDPALLHDAQVALGMPALEQNPYPYPPMFLLALLPLAGLSYWPALAAWLGVTFALYATAVLGGLPRAWPAWLIIVLAPTTALTVVFGQSGFLVAALLIGGLRLAGPRPVLAGVLFGLLTYKPQFGLLVPVALLAAGHWRCIGTAAVAAPVVAAVATAVQGPGIWAAWLGSLPGYQAWFDGLGTDLMPTVQSNLQMLGAPIVVARVVQAAASAAVAAVVWSAWRRAPGEAAVPVTLVCTVIASPHAFIYDLPLLAGAVALSVTLHRSQRRGLTWTTLGVFSLVLWFPACMAAAPWALPVAAPALVLTAWAMRPRREYRPGPAC